VTNAARLAVTTGAAAGILLTSVFAQQRSAAVWERALQEKPRFLDTLKELVSIESGSSDPAGLSRIAELIAARLHGLGGEVRQVAPPADMVRFQNTPAQLGNSVVAQFRGSGAKTILLLAHMDTVYRPGMLGQQPFRIEGDRAYGLGIADNKQGVALILHTVSMVKALSARFGLITVLITADEEVSSPASRALLTRLGSEHDLVLSCEGLTEDEDILLSTIGTGAAQLTVRGRASHAGLAPEQGRNALYELAHQLLQTRDLSDAAAGVKMNWTVAAAGTARNVIPAEARATADIRVTKLSGYDRLEQQIRKRVKHQLIADAAVEVVVERLRPPLEVREPSRRAAAHARRIYSELGVPLAIQEAPFAATDAAFAGLQTKSPVLEGLGVRGSGAHSSDAEYIVVSSVEKRLYLLTRLIMDSADGTLVAERD
jgi:glutamate carboxypeptidase